MSVLSSFSASANASTIVAGRDRIAVGLELGRPSRCPTPRLSCCSSSWQRFSTTRFRLPRDHRLVHRRGLDERQLAGSRLREVDLRGLRPAGEAVVDALLASASRSRRAGCRAAPSAPSRASSSICCSSRTSVRIARSISTSPTLSRIPEKAERIRPEAMSLQSPRIFMASRGGARRAAASDGVGVKGSGSASAPPGVAKRGSRSRPWSRYRPIYCSTQPPGTATTSGRRRPGRPAEVAAIATGALPDDGNGNDDVRARWPPRQVRAARRGSRYRDKSAQAFSTRLNDTGNGVLSSCANSDTLSSSSSHRNATSAGSLPPRGPVALQPLAVASPQLRHLLRVALRRGPGARGTSRARRSSALR